MTQALRIGLLASHPVQYHVPWYRALAAAPGLDLTVFYCLLPDARQQGVGFGVDFQWDVPMLGGYEHVLLRNVARPAGLGRFGGCDTPTIESVVKEGSFDAFIICGWEVKSYWQGLWACRKHRVPVIVRGDSNALKPRPWPVRLAHRLLLRQYSAALAVGKANAAFYSHNGFPGERIFNGPHCVDNARYAELANRLEPSRQALRAAWHIPAEACVFLFCGKLIEKKRPLDLLRALALAAREPRCPIVHLLLAGEGPMRSACERMAGELGLPVSFVGFLNQGRIAEAYVAADCLVLPSDYGETWGLVVNEAMACGRPALVSDRVGCHPDLIVPGATGAVFPFGDIGALARALIDLSTESDRLVEMGRSARRHVASYSVDALLSGTLHAARHVTGSRRAIMAAQ